LASRAPVRAKGTEYAKHNKHSCAARWVSGARFARAQERQVLEELLLLLRSEIVDREGGEPASAAAPMAGIGKQVAGLLHQRLVRHAEDFREAVQHVG